MAVIPYMHMTGVLGSACRNEVHLIQPFQGLGGWGGGGGGGMEAEKDNFRAGDPQ